MKQKLNIEEIKQKLFDKLEPSGWGQKLKPFIFSGDFDNIITQLARLSIDGKRFTPPLKQMFRAFEECPYNELKVVIVGTDPYPYINVADGIGFSCSNTDIQSNLKYMLDEINKTVYNNHPESVDGDLSRWSNQGILMLNIALTTTIGKVGQHYSIWKPFIAYIFDLLTWNKDGIVYLYLGKEAKDWSDCVNDNNYKLFLTHPATAFYTKEQSWDSQDSFNKISKLVKDQYNYSIQW
jgi:uracil-DNA glycosylase